MNAWNDLRRVLARPIAWTLGYLPQPVNPEVGVEFKLGAPFHPKYTRMTCNTKERL